MQPAPFYEDSCYTEVKLIEKTSAYTIFQFSVLSALSLRKLFSFNFEFREQIDVTICTQ